MSLSPLCAFVTSFEKFIDGVKKQHPGAIIYLQSILPVTAKKQRNDSRFQLCLGELAFYECVVHAVASFTVDVGLPKQSTTAA